MNKIICPTCKLPGYEHQRVDSIVQHKCEKGHLWSNWFCHKCGWFPDEHWSGPMPLEFVKHPCIDGEL